MRFVCPKLEEWVSFHTTIHEMWTKAGGLGMPPPIPPSMDMWASLGDDDKEQEWMRMLEWLNIHDLDELVDFPDSDWYVTGVAYINESCTGSAPLLRTPW